MANISSSSIDYTNINGSINQQFSTPRIVYISVVSTILILIAICILVGNLLVVIAVLTTKSLSTVTNYFIMSLAIADMLVAIFVLPISIYMVVLEHTWIFGSYVCDFWVSCDVMLCTASILNLCCISLDRYFAITRPLSYSQQRSPKLARGMIAIVWIASIIISSPGRLLDNERTKKPDVCELNRHLGYRIYSSMGSFFVPALVIIFVYIRIFKVIHEREKYLISSNSIGNGSLSSKIIQFNTEKGKTSKGFNNNSLNYNESDKSLCKNNTSKMKPDSGVVTSYNVSISECNSNVNRDGCYANQLEKRIDFEKRNDKLQSFESQVKFMENFKRFDNIKMKSVKRASFIKCQQHSRNGNATDFQNDDSLCTEKNMCCLFKIENDAINEETPYQSPKYSNHRFSSKKISTTNDKYRPFSGGVKKSESFSRPLTLREDDRVSSNNMETTRFVTNTNTSLYWYKKKNKREFKTIEKISSLQDNGGGGGGYDKSMTADRKYFPKSMSSSFYHLNKMNKQIESCPSNSSLNSTIQKNRYFYSNLSNQTVNRYQEHLRLLKESKAAKILAVVVGGFIACWLPFFVMYVAEGVYYYFNKETVNIIPLYMINCITWLGYINSVINPVIYAFYSQNFRAAFIRLTIGKIRRIK